jgi:hypothetical protein
MPCRKDAVLGRSIDGEQLTMLLALASKLKQEPTGDAP